MICINKMKEKKFGKGCFPDEEDNRDLIYEDIVLGAPKVDWEKGYNVEKEIGCSIPIKSQNSSSSCCGQATSYYVGVLNTLEEKKYKEVSAKSIYSQIALPDGGCVDEKTEILTTNGWKKYYEASVNDSYFTLNLDTKKIEIQKSTHLTIYHYDGDMIKLYNKNNLDLLLTPDHRCIVYNKYHKDKLEVKLAKELKKGDILPLASNGLNDDNYKENNYSDEFVSLIGWIITEGWFDGPKYGRKRNKIRIFQNKGIKADEIEKILIKLNYNYHKQERKRNGANYKKIIFTIKNPHDKEIRKIQNNKKLKLDFLLSLNKKQLLFLFNAMIAGDGCIYQRNGWGAEISFAQKDKETIENFGILCILLGYAYSIKYINNDTGGYYSLYVKKIKTTNKFISQKEKYNGIVWCPTVKNGTIIIKRNGKICITGQSYLRDGIALPVNWGALFESYLTSYDNGKPPSEKFMRDLSWKNQKADKTAKILQAKEYRKIKGINMDIVAHGIKEGHGLLGGLWGENNGTWNSLEPKPPVKEKEWGHAVFFGAYGIDKLGKFIATPNSWGSRGKDELHPNGWQKLREDYFTNEFMFNPWLLCDAPNRIMNSIDEKIKKFIISNEKKLMMEGEGKGRMGIIVNGKLRKISAKRSAQAALYSLINNGFGKTISTNMFNNLPQGKNF